METDKRNDLDVIMTAFNKALEGKSVERVQICKGTFQFKRLENSGDVVMVTRLLSDEQKVTHKSARDKARSEQNYGSYEACQRLVEKVVLETDVYWVKEKVHDGDHYELMFKLGEIFIPFTYQYSSFFLVRSCNFIPAPSMAEVWRELPELVKGHRLTIWMGTKAAIVGYEDRDSWVFYVKDTNPTTALIDLLIWVRSQKS